MAFTLPEGYIAYCKDWEEKIGAFIEFAPDLPAFPGLGAFPGGNPPDPPETLGRGETPEGPGLSEALWGKPFGVKDNIAVRGFLLTCGSKLLAKVRAPYTATAVRKLEAGGAWVAGKTNLDEFGMGSSTDNSGIKRTNNPWDFSRVPGGSSGGSAAAVSAGLVPFALGTDTGGSVRQPAAFCGVVGLKPTYGAVSRFGLVAYASSLETIGVLSDTAARSRAVFAAIRGRDPLDQTSLDPPEGAPALYGRKSGRKAIGVLSSGAVARALAGDFGVSGAASGGGLSEAVLRALETAKSRFGALGHTLAEVEIPSLRYAVPAYYTIASAEASANLARFDSVRYGARPAGAENPEDLIDRARDGGFGEEVKLRILLGTFVLRSGFQDRYYLRAQRIRAGIKRDFEALLARYDALLMPVFPTLAFGRGGGGLSPFAQRAADLYTCCANLAGLPALAFPAALEEGLPAGVQLLGRAFGEGDLLDLAESYEGAFPFPHPPGHRDFWK
ncbi:MAG: aspartyl/glutamyl-tRNA amidotransferase subunit A [Spirochaetaceae bacterium]|jgi:aspartyl-tRNA(Asn)/glutamyl-tRNA(Gln) amidotransferase subunit A|nr:aspartyl/glutamyl-tRNA amidotransferase subunit A [Spirochaetaceae bacterium]